MENWHRPRAYAWEQSCQDHYNELHSECVREVGNIRQHVNSNICAAMLQLEELAKEEVLKRTEDNCEPLRAQLIAAQKELEAQDGQLAESQSSQAF